MTDRIAIALLVIALVLLLISEIRHRGRRWALHVDNGSGKKVFCSARYGICARPDAIVNGTTIEEFKSRQTGIYTNDRIQLIATALAVRCQYPIDHGKLITQQTSHDVDLSAPDATLFSTIEQEHHHTTLIANGIAPPPSLTKEKCQSGEFNDTCEYQMNH